MSQVRYLSSTDSLKLDVSVIIPTFNEEKFISKCLSSILDQDYPQDRFEVIVVDGNSTDATCSIVERFMQSYSNIRLLHNESRITSAAMNLGLQVSHSQVIMRMDGHAEAPSNYISKSVDYLVKTKTDVVGCLMETIGSGYWGKRIALALSSPFGVGNARYRVGNDELHGQPGWLGTFWRKGLVNLGGYDESYQCNEDCELSYRMLGNGYSLYTPSNISCKYYCRTNLRALWHQYYKYGFWKVALISKLHKIPSIRNIIPALFIITIGVLALGSLFSFALLKLFVITLLSYAAFTMIGSWKAAKGKHIRFFWTIIPVFMVLHFSYGIGFVHGILSGFVRKLEIGKTFTSIKRNIRELLRPLIQNKISAFALYVTDAVYDFARYLRYSGNLYSISSDREKLESLILMYSHKIEKGLALKHPDKIDGPQVMRLIRFLEMYCTKWDCHSITFQSAYAALEKYRESLEKQLFTQKFRLKKRLDAFLRNYSPSQATSGGTKTHHHMSAAAKNRTFNYDFFVQSRHSVRNFTKKTVSQDVLNKAVDQARWTPSVCNRQPWRVHVFESENDKKRALTVQNGNDGFGDSANKILLITCDMRCFFTSRERNQYFIDGGMFSMSLIYALHAAGVASCALNLSTYSFQDIKLHRLLGIPKHETPIMMIAIGYPPDKFEVAYSGRLPIERLLTYKNDKKQL